MLAMAVAGLVVSSAVQLPSRRRDAASLRVVGVPRRQVMWAVALEFVVVLELLRWPESSPAPSPRTWS